MQFIKIVKQWKLTSLLLFIVLLVGLVLRVYNLNHLPVFGDEAIYIRWAQIMKSEPTLRFLPLSDGKQPLYMWTVMPFLKIFSDPLIAGRFVSVVTGMFTALGVFVLSYLLFKSKKAAVISFFMYMTAPFAYFFDRLAMADSMLASFGIWSIIFSIFLVNKLQLDLAMILGFVLSAALLTKSPALFFSILIPTTWILIKLPNNRREALINIIKTIFYFGLSYVIAYGFYNILLRLGPNFHMVATRNMDYLFPLSHLWQNPKDPFIFHFHRSLEWYAIYGTWGLIGLFVAGLTEIKKKPREMFVILAMFIIPILIESMFAKVFTTRYIFFTFSFFSVLAGVTFTDFDIKNYFGKIKLILLVVFLSQSGFFFWKFQTNLEQTPLARTDRSGFLEEWTSGTGIKESADIILSEYNSDPNKKIVVGTEGYFGTLPDGLQMYVAKYPITVIGVGLDLNDIPQSLIDSSVSGNKTYLVINSSRLKMNVNDSRFKIIASFRKAVRPTFVHEYTLHGAFDTLYLLQIQSVTSKDQIH